MLMQEVNPKLDKPNLIVVLRWFHSPDVPYTDWTLLGSVLTEHT